MRPQTRRRREAPGGARNAMKRVVKEIQATLWRMRFLLLIWATWMTLFMAVESLRPGLLMAPSSLWFIHLHADLAREWAWQLIILIWPQWILTFVLREERSVAQYGQKYRLMESHRKHRGGSVIFCSKYGIGVWRGFIEIIIGANNRNRSWAGSFTLQDLRMSGHRCRIASEPTHAGTYANLLLDLSKLARLILSEFSHNGVPIKFVKFLHDDMTTASSLSPAPTKAQLLEFFKNHPALKSPRQLTRFTSELFQVYKALGPNGKQMFDAIVSVVSVDDWVRRTIKTHDKLLMKVLTYSKYDPYNTASSYVSTPEGLFRFLRNFQAHGADADVITGAQNMFNMKDLEFIATYEYCAFICRLIHHLIVQTGFNTMMLEYAWKNYTEYTSLERTG